MLQTFNLFLWAQLCASLSATSLPPNHHHHHLHHWSLFCISATSLYTGAKLRLSKSWVEGVGKSTGMDPRDSRPIIKLWVKSSSRSPVVPKNPITQKPWLWSTSPTPRDDTTSGAGSCQAKVLRQKPFSLLPSLLFPLLPYLPECFKVALQSRVS